MYTLAVEILFQPDNPGKASRPIAKICGLRDDIVNDVSGYVRQPEITAAVTIRQFGVIDAEQIQNRGMDIVYVNGLFNGLEAKIIGRAVDGAPFYRAAS
jgi:hypothetical protein